MGQSLLEHYLALAREGTKVAVDSIMADLTMEMSVAESKIIDFALGQVNTDEGFIVMERYLFGGTQVQRNYCALYFARRGEYLIVRSAYDMGKIDGIQAFSR